LMALCGLHDGIYSEKPNGMRQFLERVRGHGRCVFSESACRH
jgi:hypothetical protein